MHQSVSDGVWFSQLDPAHLDQLRRVAEPEIIPAGEVLFHEGGRSDSMYFVESGRFSISIGGQQLAAIESEQTVGEIGFLSGNPRTATVTASRDSVVLKLLRPDYELLCRKSPMILQDICSSLATKVVEANKASQGLSYLSPRTIALHPGGKTIIDPGFVAMFVKVLSHYGSCKLMTRQLIQAEIVNGELTSEKAVQWRNEQERVHDYLVYLCDDADLEWSDLAVRHADILLTVCDTSLTLAEQIQPGNAELSTSAAIGEIPHWLIMLHPERSMLSHSARWLSARRVDMHHHLLVNDESYIHRLARFINGTAAGLVASGGGAYSAAHLGCFKAFHEAGLEFDIVGGSSGGAAMITSVAGHIGYQDMVDKTGEMMVTSKALKRYTVPKYGLVDHVYFDHCLMKQYGKDRMIEDFWTNYFAVSTNLSNGEEMVHRRGRIWQAVRASASIPGVLPPFIGENGDLLVDGGVINNVPLSIMKSLKHGPNIILTFQTKHQNKAGIKYDQLPGRRRQLFDLVTRAKNARPLDMPGIGSVLMQSMLLNNDSLNCAEKDDLILTMDLPKDIKLNDWARYREVAEMGYNQANVWLQQHQSHPVILRIKAFAKQRSALKNK